MAANEQNQGIIASTITGLAEGLVHGSALALGQSHETIPKQNVEDTVGEKYNQTKDYLYDAGKNLKDNISEESQQAKENISEKGQQAKDYLQEKLNTEPIDREKTNLSSFDKNLHLSGLQNQDIISNLKFKLGEIYNSANQEIKSIQDDESVKLRKINDIKAKANDDAKKVLKDEGYDETFFQTIHFPTESNL